MLLKTATIALSLVSLPFIVPHVMEDFAEGIAPRVGLSPGVAAFLLGGWFALQSLGLVLLAGGRRAGWIITFWVGLVWAVVAAVEHGPGVVTGPFRTGLPSVLWVVGLVVTQAGTAALAWRGCRRARVG